MTAKMPILQSIFRGSQFYRFGEALMTSPKEVITVTTDKKATYGASIERMPPPMVDAEYAEVVGGLRGATHFDIQTPSDLFWYGKHEYDLTKDFGEVRPPYDYMWMEWTPHAPDFGKPPAELPNASDCHYAAFLHHTQGFDDSMLSIIFFVQPTRSPDMVLVNECAIDLLLDANGMMVGLEQGKPRHLRKRPDLYELVTDDAASALTVPVLALSLMNCKNVSTERVGPVGVRRSGREKRQGVKPVEYHTIVLPGTKVQRGHESKRERREHQDMMALHRVRGHFKTYTPEAPLLGKHVGRYWWGWNVRGNKRNGEIVSEYQVEA